MTSSRRPSVAESAGSQTLTELRLWILVVARASSPCPGSPRARYPCHLLNLLFRGSSGPRRTSVVDVVYLFSLYIHTGAESDRGDRK
jgi:hypothetical protein